LHPEQAYVSKSTEKSLGFGRNLQRRLAMEMPREDRGLTVPVPAIDPISGPVIIPRPLKPHLDDPVEEEPDDDPEKAG
jgi:hypothetical protein